MVQAKHDSGRATLLPIALCGAGLLAVAAGLTLWLSRADEAPPVTPAAVAVPQAAELQPPVFERQSGDPGEARPLTAEPVEEAAQPAEPGAALPLAVDEEPPPPDFAGRVQGTVRDTRGLPVAGAQVLLGRRRTETDGEGRFAFEEVVPEPAHAIAEPLVARAAGFAVHREMQRLPTESLPVREVELTLQGAGALEGLVTDPSGQRLVSVPVRVFFEQTGTFGGEAPARLAACTDDAGHWRIEHVPPGRYLLEAGRDVQDIHWPEHPAGPGASDCRGGDTAAPVVIGDVFVNAGATTRVDFVLHPPGLLSGRVLDSLGGRLAGAEVRLESVTRWPTSLRNTHHVSAGAGFVLEARSRDDGSEPLVVFRRRIAETTSDERGEFRLERVPAGTLRLSSHLPDRPAARAELELEVAPGVHRSDADLVVPLGLDLRSMLVDRAGLPVAGATVWLEPEGTSVFGSGGSFVRSDERGVFEFLGVPPGRRILYVTHPQHASLWATVEAAELASSYVLDPALQLRLEVVDDEDGSSVPAFELSVNTPNMGMTTSLTEVAGITEVPLDNDGAATVKVTAAGYLPAVVEDVIPSHTAQVPLRVRLQRQP